MEIKSQGERLRILLDRKKVLVKDAAGPLGYKNWRSLSRLFRAASISSPTHKARVLRRQGRVLRQIIALLRAQIRYLQEQVFGAIIPALWAIQT